MSRSERLGFSMFLVLLDMMLMSFWMRWNWLCLSLDSF